VVVFKEQPILTLFVSLFNNAFPNVLVTYARNRISKDEMNVSDKIGRRKRKYWLF
jgi:hypothetical protein